MSASCVSLKLAVTQTSSSGTIASAAAPPERPGRAPRLRLTMPVAGAFTVAPRGELRVPTAASPASTCASAESARARVAATCWGAVCAERSAAADCCSPIRLRRAALRGSGSPARPRGTARVPNRPRASCRRDRCIVLLLRDLVFARSDFRRSTSFSSDGLRPVARDGPARSEPGLGRLHLCSASVTAAPACSTPPWADAHAAVAVVAVIGTFALAAAAVASASASSARARSSAICSPVDRSRRARPACV